MTTRGQQGLEEVAADGRPGPARLWDLGLLRRGGPAFSPHAPAAWSGWSSGPRLRPDTARGRRRTVGWIRVCEPRGCVGWIRVCEPRNVNLTYKIFKKVSLIKSSQSRPPAASASRHQDFSTWSPARSDAGGCALKVGTAVPCTPRASVNKRRNSLPFW